jgi:hypothetical protein
MVTLERPRRSMVGLTVEVEPVWDELTSDDEPVTDEVLPAVDPVTDGEDEAVVPLVPLVPLIVPLAEPEESEPVLPEVVPLCEPPEACESGMQSMWTGLEEWSFALPVSLSASLPALGWPRLLHNGLPAIEVDDCGVAALCEVRACWEAGAVLLALGVVLPLLDVDWA